MTNILPEINSKYNEIGVIADLLVDNHELSKNIGEIIKYKNPTCGIENETATIMAIQKNHKGEIVYRVYAKDDNFGRPVNPKDVEIII